MIINVRNTVLYLSLFLFISGYSQSIRKNYREMTENERNSLVNAFYQLRLGSNLIIDLADFHRNFSNFDGTNEPERLDIHKNLPDEPERDIFLPWHRMQMFELEQAMQDIDPNLSIPFVDWIIDNRIDSPVWDLDFMGQFDDDWELGRTLGERGNLPRSQDILFIQTFTSDFLIYSDRLERDVIHAGPHVWVGGWMGGPASPRDPIFYLHHTFIDKLWSEWEKQNNSSAFIINSMIRYDGTYVFDGKTLPLINPNDIVSTNSLGVFYAENELAVLENYEVSNRFRALENFYYQFTIEAGDAFTIADGRSARMESQKEIILKPGFIASRGSNFMAQIDQIDLLKGNADIEKGVVRNFMPFEDIVNYDMDFYLNLDQVLEEDNLSLKVYPNPFADILIVESREKMENVRIEIFDIFGKRLFSDSFKSETKIEIRKLNELTAGIYFIKIKTSNDNVITSKIIKI